MSVGSWINSGLGSAGSLARRIPGKVWLAVGCLLVAAFWMEQHDARVRQQARLQQVQQQTAVQVATLRKQAKQEVKQANVENAEAIQKLEGRGRQLTQENLRLTAQLDHLRKQARTEAEQVATLPISDVVTRVAAQLGLQPQKKLQVTNYELPKAGSHSIGVGAVGSSACAANRATFAAGEENTPHPAAGAATLSPGRGPNHASLAVITKSAASAPPANPRHKNDAVAANAKSAPPTSVVLSLTASGARKVETALVKLNACRAESNILNQQIANGQAQVHAHDATIQRQAGSIASLNQALQAKDKILGQQASECKAELRAARGTFLARLAHVTEHIAIGVAVGLAVGVVVR